jgi:hypothetical protein
LFFQIGMTLEETRGAFIVLLGEDQREAHRKLSSLMMT